MRLLKRRENEKNRQPSRDFIYAKADADFPCPVRARSGLQNLLCFTLFALS
jgi:hypothetical protein